MLYLGCHLSSSKGFAAMGRMALSIGANTFQFFTRNPEGALQRRSSPLTRRRLCRCRMREKSAALSRMRPIR